MKQSTYHMYIRDCAYSFFFLFFFLSEEDVYDKEVCLIRGAPPFRASFVR